MTLLTLVSFNGANGADPAAALMLDASGNLIGTAMSGGAANVGVVFEVQKTSSGYAAAPIILADLDKSTTGGAPDSTVVADASGNLFVSIYGGGAQGYGTLLELRPTANGYGPPTILANFSGVNGGYLGSGVVVGANGDLLGSSWAGGYNNAGSIYELAMTPTGYASSPTVIAQFSGSDGLYPNALYVDAAGNLLGTALEGGSGSGILFEIQKLPSGYAATPNVLYSFDGPHGAWPFAGLVADAAGNLFGTTQLGGVYGQGVIFELAKTAAGYASEPIILCDFDGRTGGGGQSKLLMDAAGDLFGESDLSNNSGTVYMLARTAIGYASEPVILAKFDGVNSGRPLGGLIADSQGDLFGVTVNGGPLGAGSVFEVSGARFVSAPPETVAQFLSESNLTGYRLIEDSASSVTANLDALETQYKAGHVSSIALTDSGTPQLFLSAAQLLADMDVLNVISTPITISLTDIVKPDLPLSSDQLSADLHLLESVISPYGIRLPKSPTPILTLSLPSNEVASAIKVLSDISGAYSVVLQPISTTDTIQGVAGADGNTVSFPLPAGNYAIAADGNGRSLTVDYGADATHVSGVQALQFADATVIVASSMAQGGSAVSSAEVTELYGAVFGRRPDVPGLDFYEKFAAANTTTPFLQFAQWFLASPEYQNNASHNYAQTAAGEAQFITDSYQNLLHRTPTVSEVNFYETQVISPALANLTPGTAAYTAADSQAHAQTLVYFSQSSEYLADVQVTAQNPASSQHWLILI